MAAASTEEEGASSQATPDLRREYEEEYGTMSATTETLLDQQRASLQHRAQYSIPPEPPSPVREEAAAMVDDIYRTIVQAAGGDANTVSLSLARNRFAMQAIIARMSIYGNNHYDNRIVLRCRRLRRR